MVGEQLLQKISKDIDFIKNEIIVIKTEIEEMKELDIREGYIEKLKKLERSGRFSSFKDMSSLRKEIENV